MNLVKTRIDPITATRVGSKYAIDHVWCTRGVGKRIGKVGLVPRDRVYLSDHLGIFLDVRTDGHMVEEEPASQERRYLKYGNKKNGEKYLTEVQKWFDKEKLRVAMDRLMRVHQEISDKELETKLNNIDKIVQKILIKSEKKLKPKCKGMFTDEIKEYKREIFYWRRLMSSNNRVTHSILKKWWTGHEEENW